MAFNSDEEVGFNGSRQWLIVEILRSAAEERLP